MTNTQDQADLALLFRCQLPLIVIATREEQRAQQLIRETLKKQPRALFTWSVARGLTRQDLSFDETPSDMHEPLAILKHIASVRQPAVFVLFDFHPYLNEPVHVRLLKEIAQTHDQAPRTVVLVSHELELPEELKRLGARIELRLPSSNEIRDIIEQEAREYGQEHKTRVQSQANTIDKLTRLLTGLTHNDVRRLVRYVIYDDGVISETELADVNRAKFELLNMDGVVTFAYDTAQFGEVGGLHHYKKWLNDRALFFTRSAPQGLDAPRGVLLVGVQGGGKSLAAKATAGLLGLPLLRLDFAALYNKFHGETERNLRDALKLAEAVAPCVLWVDEIEKGLSSDDSDGGTSKRILGTLLTWLSERRAPIFVVATANVIEDLPPELIRKGRFDEIFFVDLPDADVRRDIFSIHLTKRKINLAEFDLAVLSSLTEGFSGAEIEQAVIAGLYRAHGEQKALDMTMIETAINSTQPLSVVMAEHIAALRMWAEGRTVTA